ncbi:hypothetical protein H4Q26_017407 [Puccinia striiformis f. sp. tritici PST-130]|nr:hypothetical protein H4Q26_017407 [Puccinia striiformis f. sp. tritici PST-130]
MDVSTLLTIQRPMWRPQQNNPRSALQVQWPTSGSKAVPPRQAIRYQITALSNRPYWWYRPSLQEHTPESSGWLNEAKTSNCGKRVYVMRKTDVGNTQFAQIVEGCDFPTKNFTIGCAQIGLSNALFRALKATPQEEDQGFLNTPLIWDYDSFSGQHTQQAPV